VSELPKIPPAIRRSDALHSKVATFARLSLAPSAQEERDAKFEELALEIARFQQEHSPGFARMVSLNGDRLEKLSDIPVIPADVFRMSRVALHPPELDVACFQTSGTTSSATGQHGVRTLATKETLTLLQAEHTLFREDGGGVVVALSPQPGENNTSSLSHMMRLFMCAFDGKPLTPDPAGVKFSPDDPLRWLMDTRGPNVDALKRAAKIARHRSQPLYLLATSFALVALLDALDGERLSTPARTYVMLTGGFKGRSRIVNEKELRSSVARALSTTEDRVIGEYGMTELGSQLFEQRSSVEHPAEADPSLTSSRVWDRTDAAGVYFAPPWLRVNPVRPTDYRPQPPGEPGLAHFIDLANIDSCVSFVTQDLVVEQPSGGFLLLGRAKKAPARGCSLPFESFLGESR
jgi:hypothetical protein